VRTLCSTHTDQDDGALDGDGHVCPSGPGSRLCLGDLREHRLGRAVQLKQVVGGCQRHLHTWPAVSARHPRSTAARRAVRSAWQGCGQARGRQRGPPRGRRWGGGRPARAPSGGGPTVALDWAARTATPGRPHCRGGYLVSRHAHTYSPPPHRPGPTARQRRRPGGRGSKHAAVRPTRRTRACDGAGGTAGCERVCGGGSHPVAAPLVPRRAGCPGRGRRSAAGTGTP
jgi:hypothetical protein